MDGPWILIDGERVPVDLNDLHTNTGAAPESTLRPLYVVRRRLEDAGLWAAMSVILVRDHPDKLLKLLSTETTGMIDVSDPDVLGMIQLVGADPAAILA